MHRLSGVPLSCPVQQNCGNVPSQCTELVRTEIEKLPKSSDVCFFSFSFPNLPVPFSFFLPEPFPFAAVAAFRRARALTSLGSSCVSKAEHVFLAKFRSIKPKERVASLRYLSIVVVWRWSLAHACHVHNTNSRSSIRVLWGSGRRDSKTGIEH